MRRLTFAVLLVAALAPLAPAYAHDFWIEPSTFRPKAGETFTASLLVGMDFVGDPVPRTPELIESFVVRDASGERPVNGFDRQDPAGYVRVDVAGPALIGYSSKGTLLELPPEKFRQFLDEEGIRGVPAPTAPHRERFYRYAKSLVKTGNGALAIDRPFGFRLEIVPLNDPATARATSLSVLFEGQPLAGVLVTAIARDDGSRVSARTDATGRVSLNLGRGVWMVKAVQLVAAPRPSDVQWQTLWASLTFER